MLRVYSKGIKCVIVAKNLFVPFPLDPSQLPLRFCLSVCLSVRFLIECIVLRRAECVRTICVMAIYVF